MPRDFLGYRDKLRALVAREEEVITQGKEYLERLEELDELIKKLAKEGR